MSSVCPLQRYLNALSFRCSLADFQIEKKIGRGQFSEVYKATCLLDRKTVALKKVQVSQRPHEVKSLIAGASSGSQYCAPGLVPPSPPQLSSMKRELVLNSLGYGENHVDSCL